MFRAVSKLLLNGFTSSKANLASGTTWIWYKWSSIHPKYDTNPSAPFLYLVYHIWYTEFSIYRIWYTKQIGANPTVAQTIPLIRRYLTSHSKASHTSFNRCLNDSLRWSLYCTPADARSWPFFILLKVQETAVAFGNSVLEVRETTATLTPEIILADL